MRILQLVQVTLASSSLLALGCGPSARRLQAEETVRTASSALLEVHSSGGESAANVAPALEEADLWLRRAEHAVDSWEGDRSFAYETVAPCLARSLSDTREALSQAGRPSPEGLEQAEAQAADVTNAECPRPARAREPERTPSAEAPTPSEQTATP